MSKTPTLSSPCYKKSPLSRLDDWKCRKMLIYKAKMFPVLIIQHCKFRVYFLIVHKYFTSVYL